MVSVALLRVMGVWPWAPGPSPHASSFYFTHYNHLTPVTQSLD